MKAEYRKDCLQRDSVEREGYAGVPSVGTRDNRERDNATQDLLREILRGRNLLEAMKRVKGNKGAAGIDGMTVDELEPCALNMVENLCLTYGLEDINQTQ